MVSKLDCYWHGPWCEVFVTKHTLAHAYGEMTVNSSRGDYDDIPNLLQNKTDFQVWARRDQREFAHRFNEYNKNDIQKVYPYLTNRTITVASGECLEYDVEESSQIGETTAKKFNYRNQTFSDTITIPVCALGDEGTTYIYRDKAPPEDARAPEVVCGDRCMYMWVLRNRGAKGNFKNDPNGDPKLYQCPITVGYVRNAVHPAHNVPDEVARLAAVSIAVQGQLRGPINDPDYRQYRWYAVG